MVLSETSNQLEKSRARCEDLRSRIEGMKKKPEVCGEELLRKKEALESEEGKVLRRVYLLMKQIKPSLKSECLVRVAEVISQNATLTITKEEVERLLPFGDQPIVKVLKDYVE